MMVLKLIGVIIIVVFTISVIIAFGLYLYDMARKVIEIDPYEDFVSYYENVLVSKSHLKPWEASVKNAIDQEAPELADSNYRIWVKRYLDENN